MKKAFALLCLTAGILTAGLAQQTDLRQLFLEAESYYLFEEYNEALPLYLQLHRDDPDNNNVNFKIGVCLVNSPYEKDKSISYLERAIKNIDPKYKQNNFRETSAPPEALFYLGTAYRINNQLDRAREYYRKFLKTVDPEVFDTTLIIAQIEACNAAAILMKKPIDYDRQDLSEMINTRFAETNAVVSGDETKMAFISQLQFYDAIFFTEKVDGKWKAPRNIVPELGVDGDVYPTFLSYDGKEMFIYRSDNFIGNLYSTKLVNGKWSPLEKLNDNINTRYWESHASMTRDGKYLYFTSNRKGGYGGLDIYRSQRQAGGDWGPAVNLGPVINSGYNDDTPFITENGTKLYFSSYGHYNIGGYDIFLSKRKSDGSWAEPVNLGYPVNTTDDDQFFYPVRDGQVAYYSRFSPEGHGKLDIYRYEIYNQDNPRMFPISGLLQYMGEHVDSSEITISVVKSLTGDTVISVNPYANGNFRFSVPAGNYNMIFESDRFKKHMQQLSVASTTPHEGFILPGVILLEPLPLPLQLSAEEKDKLLTIRDTLITVNGSEEAKIRFNAEKDSRAIVEIYNNGVLAKTDTIEVNRKRQSYEFIPEPGRNKVVITVEDEDGNRVQKIAEVIREDNAAEMSEDDSVSHNTQVLSQNSGAVDNETGTKDVNLEILRNKLEKYAQGDLKAILDTLNMAAAGINTAEELENWLKEHAGDYDYTSEDVKELFTKTLTEKDLQEFIRDMKRVSKDRLQETLENIHPETISIETPRQLVDHLVSTAGENGFTPGDVAGSLGILASRETNDPLLLLEILKSADLSDALAAYTSKIRLRDEDIKTAADLAIHLYDHASEGNYSKKDVLNIMTGLATARGAELLRGNLTRIATGDLKALLDSLDMPSNRINTAKDLTDFLYTNKYKLNYTDDDVDALLRGELNGEIRNIEHLLHEMEGLSEGNLKEFLSSIDAGKAGFSSEEEFIGFLRTNADSLGFSEEDVDKVLLKLAYDGDLEEIIRKMADFASPGLKDRLLSLDLEKENIHTLDDVIRDLFENSDKYDFKPDDVIRMLSDYTTRGNLQLFLRRLAEVSEGNTRNFILAIDPSRLGIYSKQDLVNYLLEQAGAGNVDKTDIIHAILKVEEIPASVIIPVLKALATDDLRKLLTGTPSDIGYADDLFTYLLAKAKEDDSATKEAILDIFSKYLMNYDLQIFLKNLTGNASGDLLSLLQETNISDEGINSVEDLIRYIFDQAGNRSYTRDDVYHLLARVIAQDNLRNFVQKMKRFAGPGLRRALDELDLDKLNIRSTDDLIQYLVSVAGKYGFDISEIWDAVLKMAMDQSVMQENLKVNLEKEFSKNLFKRGVRMTIGIIVVEGLLIFILILLARRKKRRRMKEENEE